MQANQVRMSENRARMLATDKQTGTSDLMWLRLCTKTRPRNRSSSVERKEKMAHTQLVLNATCLHASHPLWPVSVEVAGEAGRPGSLSAFNESSGSRFLCESSSVRAVLSGRLRTRRSGKGVRWRHTGQTILQPRPSRKCNVSRHSRQKVWEQLSSLGLWRSKSK